MKKVHYIRLFLSSPSPSSWLFPAFPHSPPRSAPTEAQPLYRARTVRPSGSSRLSVRVRPAYSGVMLQINGTLTANDLTTLSADFQMLEGTTDGGAPRFSLADSSGNEAYLYFVSSTAAEDSPTPTPALLQVDRQLRSLHRCRCPEQRLGRIQLGISGDHLGSFSGQGGQHQNQHDLCRSRRRLHGQSDC